MMNWVPAHEKEDRSGQVWMHTELIDGEDYRFTMLVLFSEIDEDYPDEVQHSTLVTHEDGTAHYESYGECFFRHTSPYLRAV